MVVKNSAENLALHKAGETMSVLCPLFLLLQMLNELFHSLSVVIVAIFFVILGYRPPWWNRKFRNNNCRPDDVAGIPGPLSLPVLGTRWMFSVGGYTFNKIHEMYKDMHSRYGPIVKEEALFNVPVISVFEKRDIEKVLKSSGKYPVRPPTEAIAQYRRSRPDRYASTGIVNEQGSIFLFK